MCYLVVAKAKQRLFLYPDSQRNCLQQCKCVIAVAHFMDIRITEGPGYAVMCVPFLAIRVVVFIPEDVTEERLVGAFPHTGICNIFSFRELLFCLGTIHESDTRACVAEVLKRTSVLCFGSEFLFP